MPSNKTQQQLCQFVVTYKRPINILTKLKEVTKICFLPTIFRNENVTNLIRHRIPRWSIKVGYWCHKYVDKEIHVTACGALQKRMFMECKQ